jgi:hypothetical protein
MLVVAAWVARRLAWWLRRLAPAWLSLLPPGGRSQPFRRSRWRLLRHRHSPLSVVASDVVETAKFALGLQDGHGFRYANSAFRQAKLHSTKKPPAGLTGGLHCRGFLLAASPDRELACPVPPGSDTPGDLLGYLGPEVISFTDGKVGKTSEPSHVISQ